MIAVTKIRIILHHVLSAFAVAECFEEIPAPDLARRAKQFQPWINPGPPYTDHHLISRGENLDAAKLVTQRSHIYEVGQDPENTASNA